ncbi:MAG: T9SS C-terminal target domain-containing protein [Calditrichaeota bacterium]|nr:MAG: T9SS C-terminal target domain-containing protein [Calditrichota bacterium]
MDNFYELFNSSSSEMSQISDYKFAFCDNTEHYRESGGKSCWQVVDELFTKDIDGIPLPIFRPDERNLADGAPYQYIGPNDDLSSPDYDIGAKLEVTRNILSNASSTRVIQIYNQSTMEPGRYAQVELVKFQKTYPERYQDQGKSSVTGGIKVLGAENGDSLNISGVQQSLPSQGNYSKQSVADYSWFSSKVELTGTDTMNVNVTEVVGSFPVLCNASLDSNSVTLEITPENLFSEDPSVTVFTDSGVSSSQTLPITSGVYQSVLIDSIFSGGKFEIQTLDANTDTFFFPIDFQFYNVQDTLTPYDVFSNGQDLSIRIDSTIGMYTKVLVLSTNYPIMPGLLPSVSKQVSRAHSLSVYPNSEFNADARLSISYFNTILNNDTSLYENELSIHIHKWDMVAHDWVMLPTVLDTSYGIATASIDGPGIYAAFTTDVNTGVVISNTNVLPTTYTLSQNYPNPFNPETKVEFALPSKSDVKLVIHNVLGQTVKTLVDSELPAGNHAVYWDGSDESGHKVASGVYLYRFKAGEYSETKKMVLLR